jgi:transcriptional regulator with XRE-family HTH domain
VYRDRFRVLIHCGRFVGGRKTRDTHGVPVSIDVEPDVQAERIGTRIRRLRHARGLTLVQLAEAAELSHPFLSQLERGLARPSIGSLEKIARALGSSQLELLAEDDDPDQSPVALVRAGGGTAGHYGEGEARMLVTGRRRFHPMEVVGDNRGVSDYFTHAEDEFLHVAAGRVEVDLGEWGVHELETGDSLYYAGGTPHRWRALDDAGYRLLVVKEHPARL